MPELALQLLRHGVDVAEAALQRMVFEDRGSPGGVVGKVHRLARLVNGMGRGHADVHALRNRDGGAGGKILPDVGHRLQHVAARGAEIDLGLGEVALDHRIVPQRAPGAARHLVAHRFDKIVERGAGDAAGDAGKAHLVASVGAHAVERAAFAAFPVEFAGDRMIGTNEEIVQGELVAGGAAQADGVPDVGPFDVFGAHQHGALERGAIGIVSG